MTRIKLQTALEQFHRVPLLDGVTPIQRLIRLEQALAPESKDIQLYVKRDDLAGLGGGGNKLRKLEFLMGEAQAQGCDTFITTGGLQSNHARLSAAVAARMGLACELVLSHMVPRDDLDYRHSGNVLLNHVFGAVIHELPGTSDALAFAQERADELRRAGRRPYVVGLGGSSPIGCLGYAACAEEILAQEETSGLRFTRIIMPNGSGGMQAGLAAGLAKAGQDTRRLQAFTVLAHAADAHHQTLATARATLAHLDPQADLQDDAIQVDGRQLGEGYGIPTTAMIEALQLMARTEGLLLDPVYSAKAFAGLLHDVRAGMVVEGEAVLFIMTGGTPALFAYRQILDPSSSGPDTF